MSPRDIESLISECRRRADCIVDEPRGLPTVLPPSAFPEDLAVFYRECGGIRFVEPQFEIVPPTRLLPINIVVLGDEVPDDPSASWYLIGESDPSSAEERVSIDLRPRFLGRCYDSFWDSHGVVGSMRVVAKSFTDFVERTLWSGSLYWNDPRFEALGDAYDG